MPRVRVGVVLLVPQPVATEVEGLRRACGDPQRQRVAPHLTLVPPVNVRVEALPEVLAVLRAAASAAGPLALELGPPRSFEPVTDVLHLAVGGEPGAIEALHRLRADVRRPPLDRRSEHPYVPHVTIGDDIGAARIAAALEALADYVHPVVFERLHLLEEQGGHGRPRRWVPIADAAFARSALVGRGGYELELHRSQLVDPEAAAAERAALAADRDEPVDGERVEGERAAGVRAGREPIGRERGRWDRSVAVAVTESPVGEPPRLDLPAAAPVTGPLPIGAAPLVITARHRGSVVGVGRGWARGDEGELTSLVVVPEARRRGVSRQVALAFDAACAEAAVSSA